jgi:5-methylthioadenosine/S-adenosylhomocysteine deaminase
VPQPCDILLAGGFVVTMERPQGRTFWPGSVGIRDTDIVAVGPSAEVEAQWHARLRLDCSAHAILPGLVNSHVHAGMSLLKGRAGDRPLHRRLREVVWPFAQAMDERASYLGTRLGCLEMMKAGITTFADMWPFPDATAEAAKSCGLRAVLASYGRTHTVGELEALAAAPKRWNDPRLTPAIGIQSLYGVEADTLRQAAATARDRGLRIHLHASETREEVDDGHDFYEIDALGLLRPGTILAHAVHATERELDLAAERGAGIAHNPIANAKLGTGIAPLALMQARLPVGLGTDSAAANDRHDLFDEMRMALLLDRRRGEASTLAPADALAMATIGGASVLGLDSEIGSIESGKRADIIAIDLDDPRFVPLHRDRPAQVLSHFVFSATGADVETVIVHGRIVVRNGVAENLDEADIIAKGREAAASRLSAAGFARVQYRPVAAHGHPPA